MTSRIGNFDFALVEGLWCSWCGTDIRAIDVEPIDDDGGLRLCCRDCGQFVPFRAGAAAMKITAAAGDIAHALAIVGIGVMKRTAGVSAVHIAAANGEVSLSTQFLELAVAAKAIATIIEPGNAATSAMPLIDLIDGLPPGAPVSVDRKRNGGRRATCGNHRSRLPLMPWETLPSMISSDDKTGSIEITGADLATLLEPLPAAENEKTQYCCCGIHWRSIGGALVAVATNGTKLILTSVVADRFSDGLIVPREGAAVLAKLLKNAKPETVTLRCSPRLVAANCATFSSSAS